MKIKDKNLTELRTMSFADIAYEILIEEKKKLNTPKLFRKVCDLLEYTDEEYEAKIGDFYTSLTTDCRFIILDTAEWDLKDKHIVKETVDDDEDEEITNDEEELEEETEDETEEEIDEEDDVDNIDDVDDIDDLDDDMEDLSIIEDEELEEEES